mgnify:CR=1 FL=1
MESRKEKGQYMTPKRIVVMILDDIGYAGDEVLTKKIMEPSFGDGAFLSEIVKRIIKEGQKQSLSEKEISDRSKDREQKYSQGTSQKTPESTFLSGQYTRSELL